MTVKKVVLVGLIVLLLESVAGYIYLTYRKEALPLPPAMSPVASSTPLSSTALPKKAFLILETTSSGIYKGDTVKLNTYLKAAAGNVSAVDLTIKYDPSFVTVAASDSARPFALSSIFSKTVFNSLDEKHGLATMSAVIEEGPAFSGEGLLTSLMLKSKKPGSTEISIVFTPGETRDTNVVSETKDILESVQNLKLNILP